MPRENSNNELFIVKKMMNGDMVSFKFFFDKYYRELCNFVNIYVHNQELSEEIVQDIFVYFWENKEKINIDSSVKSYLFAASKFKSLNLLRDLKTRKKIVDKLSENNVLNFQENENIYLENNEFRKILESAIERLPEKCREIFLLSKEKELSNKEIAIQLGISVKTVENQMTIALRKLREYLLPFRDKIFLIFLLSYLQ